MNEKISKILKKLSRSLEYLCVKYVDETHKNCESKHQEQ